MVQVSGLWAVASGGRGLGKPAGAREARQSGPSSKARPHLCPSPALCSPSGLGADTGQSRAPSQPCSRVTHQASESHFLQETQADALRPWRGAIA